MKYSPAPWRPVKNPESGVIYIMAGEHVVAMVPGTNNLDLDNAMLICLSPINHELAEESKRILPILEGLAKSPIMI